MPCYRCGLRQTDPERGQSPWRRGVLADQLVLICPACQQAPDWAADLEHCAKCRSAHLIRRLGQVECLDCGLIRDPADTLVPVGARDRHRQDRHGHRPDTALADEVNRALDRILGRA